MSIAPRETKCFSACTIWPGQSLRFGQRVQTSPSGFTVGVPHSGHFAGGTYGRSLPVRRWVIGDTTCGITSPARMITTSSPSRMSLRARSSSLWRVALLTVTPPTSTGFSMAYGTMLPVRPTFTPICSSLVTAVVGENLKAIAQRGSRPTMPSSRCASKSLTFTTTPSISKSRCSRRSSQAWHAATTEEKSSWSSTSRLTLNPRARSHSSDSKCVWRSSALAGADAVAPDRQGARRCQLRVELADRAGRRVAGIRERALARGGALLVQPGEVGQRQVHLAANLQERRGPFAVRRQRQRDRPDRAQVVGHVLADLTVAPGRAADQHAVLVDERDRETVDLRLGHVLDRRRVEAAPLQRVVQPLLPGAQLILVPGVPERHHRDRVPDRCEALQRPPADPLCGRVGRAQLRVLLLEPPQLSQEAVVVGIRDDGIVEDVIAVVVTLDLAAQLRGSLRRVARGHQGEAGARATRDGQVPALELLDAPRVGELEVQRSDGDHVGVQRSEVGAVLVVVGRIVTVDAVALATTAVEVLLLQLQPVPVDALAEPGHGGARQVLRRKPPGSSRSEGCRPAGGGRAGRRPGARRRPRPR